MFQPANTQIFHPSWGSSFGRAFLWRSLELIILYFILLYKQQCLAKEQVTERNRGGRGRRRPTKQLFHVGALQKPYFTTHSLACFPVRQTLPDLHPPENSHTDISLSPRLPQHRTSRGLHISLKLPPFCAPAHSLSGDRYLPRAAATCHSLQLLTHQESSCGDVGKHQKCALHS